MGCFGPTHEVPIIVRGEGCYVWDEHGNRYLDGLSALFCVNSGHGRTELGDARRPRSRELDFITVWSYAHPRAIELATRIASLTPGRPEPRLLHQQRLGGGRVGDQARAQLPPAEGQRPEDQADRARDRLPRHHARRALSATGIPALRTPVRAARPGRLSTSPTPTATAGRTTATRSGPPTRSRSGSCSRGRRPSPR